MKKFTANSTGGAPVNQDDLKTIFNDEIWAPMQALLSPFDADIRGIIVSGCVITDNSGNFDMTAGIVYLNGEFMRISAVTNQAFTKYIAPSSAVSDIRTFADTTTHEVASTKSAALVSSAPGSGQYIPISSLTSVDDRRLSFPVLSTTELRKKTFSIGDWNMVSTSAKNVPLPGIDITSIRSVNVILRNDTDDTYYQYDGINGIDSFGIVLTRDPAGIFNSTNFDSTSYNRGFVTIDYIP